MNKMYMEENYFKSRDLSISAYLFSRTEVSFVRTERQGEDVYFLFQPKNKAEELVTLYWSDSAPEVQPRILFNSLRNLKDLIFGGNH